MTDVQTNGVSEQATAPEGITPPPFEIPFPEFDSKQILTEAYEAHIHDLAREGLPLDKLLESKILAVKVHGHLNESEYRRFALAFISRENSLCLKKLAQKHEMISSGILNGIFTELNVRMGLDAVKPPPTLHHLTGALVTSVPKTEIPPAPPSVDEVTKH